MGLGGRSKDMGRPEGVALVGLKWAKKNDVINVQPLT